MKGIYSLGICLYLTTTSWACSIPVFRYALERWAPSKYELVIFHRGTPTKEQQARIQELRDKGATANLRINTIDVASNQEPETKKIWDRLGKEPELPHLVLRYPESNDKTPFVWNSPLVSPIWNNLIESPGRQHILDRLTLGDTSTVILLLSGKVEEDRKAREFLAKNIPQIAQRIVLPPQTMEGPQIKSVLPIDVRFQVLELKRDAQESLLTQMLLKSEEGLEDVPGPIAFPVYGRGRALCSLHGDDLQKPDELQRALEFVCRACSCQVKELNPGVDLLIHGDWDQVFLAERGPMPREAVAPKPETSKIPPPMETTEVIVPTPESPAISTSVTSVYRKPAPQNSPVEQSKLDTPTDWTTYKPYALVVAALLVVLTLIWAWRSHQANLQRLS